MENHYHLVLETPKGNLSRGMGYLNGIYALWLNKKYKRVGHLFQGRYRSIIVEKEAYLIALCKYIVLNPVREDLVEFPESWRWSSYRAMIGESEKPAALAIDWILSQFGDNKKSAMHLFKNYVMEVRDKEFPLTDVKGQIILGGKKLEEKLKVIVKGGEDLKEISKAQKYFTRPNLTEFIPGKTIRGRKLKTEKIYEAYTIYEYTMKEIADYIGVHYCTISRIIKRRETKRRDNKI